MSSPEPRDVERLRAAVAALAETGSTSDASVDAGRIFDALHGDLTVEQRQAVIDELVTNPAAAEAWRLAKELDPAAAAGFGDAGRPATVVPFPLARRVRTWLPLAAGLLLAVAAGWLYIDPFGDREAPGYRSTGGVAIASTIPSGAALPRGDAVLRWTPIDGARYRVRVLTTALEPLHEATDLAGAEYRLPAEVVSQIPAATDLLWQVEARVPGAPVVVSPTFIVRLQ